MKFTKEQIKGAVVGAIVGAAVFLCVSLSTNIEQNKSSVEPTEVVYDTVVVYDTLPFVGIPESSREIDYIYLTVTKMEIHDLCNKALALAQKGGRSNLLKAKAISRQSKAKCKELEEYRSHLIYVD